MLGASGLRASHERRCNAGDWFNRLDWTMESNHFGMGLPVATKNKENWVNKQPLLQDASLSQSPEQIRASSDRFKGLLQIRYSSPLFRLRSREEVQKQLSFLNTGPDQVRGFSFAWETHSESNDLDIYIRR